MYPGFRYHVVTIVAIFLALGVGMIIGSSFVQGAIVERQTHQLVELRNQFTNDVLQAQSKNKHYSDFVAALAPRLNGIRVAIIQTGDYPDTTRHIRDTLEQAGSTVSSQTLFDYSFPTRLQTNMATILPKLQSAHPGLTGDANTILRIIAEDIARGGNNSDLDTLANANLLTKEGDYTKQNDVVVVVGGATVDNDSRADQLDVPLITELKKNGVSVIAAEPENAGISYVTSLRTLDITTVDNADTDIGRLSVAIALRSSRGNYGVKPTARNGIFPPCILSDDIRRRSSME